MNTTELKDMRHLRADGTRRPITQASHAPGQIYSSEEVLELEKQNIFMKEWLCVARVEEVEKPGDYFSTRIIGEPVLIVRNNEGRINAFANVCLHRGVEIASGEGNAQSFSCPYHAWMYDLDGNLTSASFMRESKDFDPKACRLKSLHVGEWAGWVFINFSAAPIPLEDALSEFAPDVDLLKMENLRLGTKITLDLPTNWKFVVENLMDVYHVRTLHYNSFGKHRGPPENYPFHLRKNGGTCTRYEARPMTPEGETLFGRMPALAEGPDNFAMSAHLGPNMQVIARVDNVHPLVMWPPHRHDQSHLCVQPVPQGMVRPARLRREDRRLRQVHALRARRGRHHDEFAADGITSANYQPGRFSTLEKGIHHVLNDYLGKVFAE